MHDYTVEKMSCQPDPKTIRQVKTQPNKQEELYKHIEMQEEGSSRYMTINRALTTLRTNNTN